MKSFKDISNIEFDVTESCNLKCRYCYLQSGSKKTVNALNANVFDIFFKKHISHMDRINNLNISFWGGEPLLNFNIIKYIVASYIPFRSKDRKISFLIVTNGMLLNEDVIVWCGYNDVRIQITLDGPKNTHNKIRIDKNDAGTFDLIVKNIHLCKMLGVDYHILTTLTKISPQPSKILSNYKGEGIKNPFFNIINPISNYDYDYLSPIDGCSIGDDIFTEFRDSFKVDHIKALYDYPNVYFIMERFFSSAPRQTCGLDSNRKAIKYDGSIYPCRRMVDSPLQSIGNVWDGIDDKYEDLYYNVINRNVSCSSCEYNLFCGGTCVEEIIKRDNINYVQDDLCAFIKILCYNTMRFIVELYRGDYKIFESICSFYNYNNNFKLLAVKPNNTLSCNGVLFKSEYAKVINLDEDGIIYLSNDFAHKYIANITTMVIWYLINNKNSINDIVNEMALICDIHVDSIEEDICLQILEFINHRLVEMR